LLACDLFKAVGGALRTAESQSQPFDDSFFGSSSPTMRPSNPSLQRMTPIIGSNGAYHWA
jgi:hypothetical protein